MSAAPEVAVVTGASVGIGEAIARRFVADGARVFGLSRRPCPVDGAVGLAVDLASGPAVREAISWLRARIGAPTRLHLVHNAAVMEQDSARALDPAAFERCLRLGVVTPAELTAGLVDRMSGGSSVIAIGSTLSEKAVPGRLSYVTSKHALVGLVRATVQDLFGAGIHSVCVCPGFTDTEMLRPVLERDPDVRKAVLSMVSFGRLLDPREIADVVAFAARTPALNGAVIHANLGQREA